PSPQLTNHCCCKNLINTLSENVVLDSPFEQIIRWLLDRPGVNIALWGARRPDQLDPVSDTMGWELDDSSMESIDEILKETVIDPIGPEFMAPPASVP
ncbi:MAG: aldo/keto reductase, partial [Candidatus Marinimicrobia bacterium]|nr:aldo/keto reductase [Candidatus Neomarinimicrobiota bacterium]